MTVMMTMKTTTAAVLLVLWSMSATWMEVESATIKGGRVLLVSMDGFRADYIQKISGLDNFKHIAKTGCTVDYVKPAFATKTFPCHYTIATGLYEESHGIVANRMYDPVHNATFNKGSKEPFWWDGGEPVWVTAERQNKKAGVHFWPGSEVEIRGYRPSIHLKYNESMPFPERVQNVMRWFKEENMDLVLLYFHEPDRTGHNFGPHSSEIDAKVKEMDGIAGLILESLENEGLDDVNLIITADHGMTEVDAHERVLHLWDYVSESMLERVTDSGVVTAIEPKAGKEEEVLTALRTIPNVTVYRKEDIPEHFHYSNNPRIMPIIVLADEGWLLTSRLQKVLNVNEKGDHGYSNLLPSMRAIFFAKGPGFRDGARTDYIRSIDIYPLVCHLLNIEPAPNNGSLAMSSKLYTSGGVLSNLCGRFNWVCVGILAVISKLF